MPTLMPGTRGREGRPSPEALLLEAQQGTRGRLKIFFGAAPGVGKTYEMLSAAQARRRDGADVVVGVVETHGRAETEALLQGLEVIPLHPVEYRGRTLQEMDIDAILARHPQLVLVDELAHTNAPGSRHLKRYKDVEELIAAGIDVWTTLNIQHVESLNDVVARITGVQVRETVPDSIIDQADEIELVDLTPEDLIQRLKEGKVYVPDQAARAIGNYFSAGNLTALRELALRRTAQRVDQQMLRHMQAHAIPGPWDAAERILVCIGADASGVELVRHAKRMADQFKAPWIALHVETAAERRMDEALRSRIAETLRLAQRLGAEAVTLPGEDAAETIATFARDSNITQIVVAKPDMLRLRNILSGSVTRQLVRRQCGATIHLVARTGEKDGEATVRFSPENKGYFASFGLVLVALGVALALREALAVGSLALVFLTAVLISAAVHGLWPALVACIACVLAYNFFFLPPLYTFTIADPENIVALFFFAIAAVITSNLTARVRSQAIAARSRARTAEELYQFSRKLAGAASLDDLLWATVHQMALMLKVHIVVLLPDNGGLAVRAGYPPEDRLEEADLAAARWCWEHTRPAGRGADTLPGAKRLFLPMRTGRGPVGVVGIDKDEPGPMLTPEQQRLLDALADQAALAVERVSLAADMDRVRFAAESDRLRSALLTSISHDLRTPLSSILGSATSLRGSLDERTRQELIETIKDEAERLNRFIANLLDMSRLESGPLPLRTQLVDLADVLGSALRRAARILAAHKVSLRLEANLPLLQLDDVLFEQALFNLLDNAAKYAPAATTISIAAFRNGGKVILRISDEGEGIPPESLEHIFEKFYRAGGADRRRAGTGLGLAICRGFIEAMHGAISAANRTDRPGAVFTIELPVPGGGQSGKPA